MELTCHDGKTQSHQTLMSRREDAEKATSLSSFIFHGRPFRQSWSVSLIILISVDIIARLSPSLLVPDWELSLYNVSLKLSLHHLRHASFNLQRAVCRTQKTHIFFCSRISATVLHSFAFTVPGDTTRGRRNKTAICPEAKANRCVYQALQRM